MNKLLSISAIAVFAAAGSAFAADPIVPGPAPVVPPVVDDSSIWDGFYAGLNGGYGWGEGTAGGITENLDGWVGGAQAGYNFRSGGMVFGVEADIQAARIVYQEDLGGGVTGETGIGTFGTIRGRIGADLDGFMPYLTAGVAYGNLFGEISGGGIPTISDDEWTWGWTAGAGVEAAVFEDVSLKAEYLYVGLNEVTFNNLAVDAEAHAHVIRAGFNFHF